MIKKLFIGLVLFAWLAPFTALSQKLRVAVAANAQFVAKQLAVAFKQQTGLNAELVIGSSGKLTTQIEQGAPFNIFLSADMKYPQELYQKKLTTAAPKVYAYGTLVLWAIKPIALNQGIKALNNPAIQKIAIANATLAPYGIAAEQAMQHMGLFKSLKPKLVYGESIAQVNQYLLTGAADAAFTAKSVVLDPSQKNKGHWVAINNKLYEPIAQGVVIIKSSSNTSTAVAQKFYTFLFSAKAKQIFKAYGYR